MQRDLGIMLWLPRILGCCLIVGWTMASTGSRAIKPIVNSQDLVAAGSLLAEYRMSALLYLPPKAVVEAVKIPRFAQQLEAASPMVKFLLVMKMIAALGGRSDFVKHMPDALAPYVPQYELAFGYKFDTQDLNRKPWLSEQAAVFFDDLIQRNVNFNSLSPFVLSGFTCAVVNSLSAERFRQLTKALKQKNVPLKEEQLSCLENSLKFHGLASQFEDFPLELFLFSRSAVSRKSGLSLFSKDLFAIHRISLDLRGHRYFIETRGVSPPVFCHLTRLHKREELSRCTTLTLPGTTEFPGRYKPPHFNWAAPHSPVAYPLDTNCKKHIANIGRDDAAILKKTSTQRKRLLKLALLCWQISDHQIRKEYAESLGLLTCELDSNYIKASGKNFLKQLNQCHFFTQDQITAIRALLISGRTSFGPPSKWTASHLSGLKGLIYLFDQKILSEIPKGLLIPWLKTFVQDSHLPREKLVGFMEHLHRAFKRQGTSGCPANKKITEEVAKDPLMPIDYTPEELRACLTPAVLKKYLHFMSQQAFTTEQANVVKEKLDEIYPGGYPDSVLLSLGGFLFDMIPDDIMKWKITSIDTLYSLLVIPPPDMVASAIIKKYTDSEQFLDGFSMFVIGTRYICLLDAKQLGYIDEESIRLSASLDPSGCSQTTKDVLYPKAKYAFFHQQNDRADYYNLMKPYLGGAPSDDLKILHNYEINMDIGTFMNLRQSSLMKLTPSEVKGLLGVNLQDLKKNQDKTPVKEWIQLQDPEDLEKIGAGLTSGIPGREHLTTTTPPDSAAARPFVSSGPALYLFHAFLLALLLHFFRL